MAIGQRGDGGGQPEGDDDADGERLTTECGVDGEDPAVQVWKPGWR